jgi:hypothetical protein
MHDTINTLSIYDFKKIISDTVQEVLLNYIEDFQALSSKAYINSIQEARNDYKSGNSIDLEDLLSV